MKVAQKDFPAQVARAAKGCSVFFFCGPDEGGVQDAAQRILSLLPDPGEKVEFTGAELRRDVARLGMRRARPRCSATGVTSGCGRRG
jgi:DNA polymerase-3 subunit delta